MNGVQPRPFRYRGRLNRRGRKQRRIYRWRSLNDYQQRRHDRDLDLAAFLYRPPRVPYSYSSLLRAPAFEVDPPLPKFDLPPLPLTRPPTTMVCGVDVVISGYAPPGWFGWVKGIGLVAHDVAAAEAVLGRIVWTDPPCWVGEDGQLVEIPREG